MKDYGEPIGWWCPECGRKYAGDDLGIGWSNVSAWAGCVRHLPPLARATDWHHWVWCIPVYAVIPEGERPDADEPDDDTVCRWCVVVGVNRVEVIRVDVATPARKRVAFNVAVGYRTGPCTDDDPATFASLADAVLWVACEVLP